MEMEQPCGALSFVESVKSIIGEIKGVLGSNLTENQREKIIKNFYRLKEAFACFQKQAEHLELVLVMTGTTSSGKSTLANFLIGEAILPAAVQEMSAGLVRVRHSYKRKLTIPRTKGATWETGRWNDITASEVCQRLEATMNAFRLA